MDRYKGLRIRALVLTTCILPTFVEFEMVRQIYARPHILNFIETSLMKRQRKNLFYLIIS
jgi:hypothetical protein